MPTESERRFIKRQYNYGRVPNPLVECLVYANISGVHPARLWQHIDQLQAENEQAKRIEDN